MFGEITTSTMRASIRKDVRCEHCSTEYLYFAECQVEGRGSNLFYLDPDGAQSRATEDASKKLHKALKSSVELSPCPRCGKFQPNMLRTKRIKLLYACLILGLLTTIPAVILSIAYGSRFDVAEPTSHYLLKSGIGVLALVCTVLAALLLLFDPNNGRFFPFGRKSVRRSLTPEQQQDFEQEMTALEADDLASRLDAQAAYAEVNDKKREIALAKREAEMRRVAEHAKKNS